MHNSLCGVLRPGHGSSRSKKLGIGVEDLESLSTKHGRESSLELDGGYIDNRVVDMRSSGLLESAAGALESDEMINKLSEFCFV
jgi:hypothetical protein